MRAVLGDSQTVEVGWTSRAIAAAAGTGRDSLLQFLQAEARLGRDLLLELHEAESLLRRRRCIGRTGLFGRIAFVLRIHVWTPC